MRRPSKYYAELFVRASTGVAVEELDALTQSFVKHLAKENALSRFPEISRLVSTAIDRTSGREDLKITTAEPLKATAFQSLTREAKAAGFGQVEAMVDSELIGGAILRAGDRRLDQSVKGALARLYETLTS